MKGSSVFAPRAEELLAERALRPLDDGELRELEQLGVADDDSFDVAAAAVVLASTPIEPMPEHLAARILAAAPQQSFTRTLPGVAFELPRDTLVGVELSDLAPTPQVPAERPLSGAPLPQQSVPLAAQVAPAMTTQQALADVRPSRDVIDLDARRQAPVSKPRRTVLPWLAAAACLIVAIGAIWRGTQSEPTRTSTPTQARADLLASVTDAAPIKWTAKDDPTSKSATGDVVWSTSQQRGYMRFTGLAINDPTQFQYQLWIFDKARDAAFPVDGGVFDVSSTGEVTVAISPKLHVSDATLFAVTVEKPGGVVVSKRERIVVTAARG